MCACVCGRTLRVRTQASGEALALSREADYASVVYRNSNMSLRLARSDVLRCAARCGARSRSPCHATHVPARDYSVALSDIGGPGAGEGGN